MSEKIKVLLVDDSEHIRRTIQLLYNDDETIQVIAEASDPFEAVKEIQLLKPDVLLLDIEMPKMNGLVFLKNLMTKNPIPVIIFSAFVNEGSENALKAFEYGAIDIIEKPKLSTPVEFNKYKNKLSAALQTAKNANVSPIDNTEKTFFKIEEKTASKFGSYFSPEHEVSYIIAIGASTGGTEVVKWFLDSIPEQFPPILIVQHMPAGFTQSFAERLNNSSKIEVKEAEDNEPLKNGCAYIARGDRHLILNKENNNFQIILSDAEPVNRHKPSVDILFNSVAEHFTTNSVGIILTGMGTDGTEGLKNMKNSGAYTIAQDENTSIVFGMPKSAILAGVIDNVLPIYKIPENLIKLVEKFITKEK
jgi:two-component system chemotaxis response regulator CheB